MKNLTPHNIYLQMDDGDDERDRVKFVPDRSGPARVAEDVRPSDPILSGTVMASVTVEDDSETEVWVPTVCKRWGKIEGLPKERYPTYKKDYDFYDPEPIIVSALVAAAMVEQHFDMIYVYSPDTGPDSAIREDGQVVAVRRFVDWAHHDRTVDVTPGPEGR